jgi:hypothetical protein
MTITDAYIFFAILIHCGCVKEHSWKKYWAKPRYAQDSVPSIGRYMGLKRFQILWKFFTVSPSSLMDVGRPPEPILNRKRKRKDTQDPVDKGFFEKLEPLTSHIRDICKRLYTPGTHVTINESMSAYRERTSHTTKLKNKPIKEGYKMWALAEHGYIWSWLFYSLRDGTERIREARDPAIPTDMNPTHTMVMKLAMELPYKEYNYVLYLDNLFTSVPLLNALEKLKIGATGTTRKNSQRISPYLLSLKQNNRDLV